MKAVLRKVELKDLKTKDGRNFQKVEFTADVISDDNNVRTYKGSYGVDYAKRYFSYCGIKTKDLVGQEVDVTLAKRSYECKGETRMVTYIQWLNVIKDGKPVTLPKEGTKELDF